MKILLSHVIRTLQLLPLFTTVPTTDPTTVPTPDRKVLRVGGEERTTQICNGSGGGTVVGSVVGTVVNYRMGCRNRC